jgi:hypothetical protein
MLLMVTGSYAGPNEGVLLFVQGNVDGVETDGIPCYIPIPDVCDELCPDAVPVEAALEWFFAVVVSPPENNPAIFAVQFGVRYYESAGPQILLWGPCRPEFGPQELPTPGWPLPNTGVFVFWPGGVMTNHIEPIYYFGMYAPYIWDEGIPLGAHSEGNAGVFTLAGDFDLFLDAGIMGVGDHHSGWNPSCPGTSSVPDVDESLGFQETTWGQIKSIYH